MKYDLPSAPPFSDAERLRAAAAGRPIVVAGSTGEGEEALVLDAWQPLDPRPFLVLAPRRPERFDGVAQPRAGPRVDARAAQPRRSAPPASRPTSICSTRSASSPRSTPKRRSPSSAEASSRAAARTRSRRGPPESPRSPGPTWRTSATSRPRAKSRGILTRVADAAGLGRAIAAASPRRKTRGGAAADAARFVEENRGAADRTAAAVLALSPRSSQPGRARDPVAARRALRQGPFAARRLVRLGPPGVPPAAPAVDLGGQPHVRRHGQDPVRRVPRAAPALRGLAPGHPLARLRAPVARRRRRERRGGRPGVGGGRRRRAGRARPLHCPASSSSSASGASTRRGARPTSARTSSFSTTGSSISRCAAT